MCYPEAPEVQYSGVCVIRRSVTEPEAKKGHLTCTVLDGTALEEPSTSGLPRTTKCLSRRKNEWSSLIIHAGLFHCHGEGTLVYKADQHINTEQSSNCTILKQDIDRR